MSANMFMLLQGETLAFSHRNLGTLVDWHPSHPSGKRLDVAGAPAGAALHNQPIGRHPRLLATHRVRALVIYCDLQALQTRFLGHLQVQHSQHALSRQYTLLPALRDAHVQSLICILK
jgi:hypothetical protein